jgi:RIO kinase 1
MPDHDESGPLRPFDPTFTGSRQERAWIRDNLSGLYQDRWFTDVLYRVSGGKEATVYCCRAHPSTGFDLLAAKVFRPRVFRAMRNDSRYKLGRTALDEEGKTLRGSREHRALRKRTSFGKRLDAVSWCQHEYKTLRRLFDAGADVPRPLVVVENAILMEFVGDENGPADLLQSVRLGEAEARSVLERLVRNVGVMLDVYRIHADLSAYNVLYHEGEVTIIDLPQCVDALRHPEAFELLTRDLDRLCRYFARQGVERNAQVLAWNLWERHLGVQPA